MVPAFAAGSGLSSFIPFQRTTLYRAVVYALSFPAMPTSIEQLERWMQSPREVEGLEFKAAREAYHGNDLVEYCVAIANEGGGQLILGITDNPPRTVCGTRAVGDIQGMQNKVFDVLRFDVRIEELIHPSGRVIICHIPSRPRGTPLHHNGKYLMRSGEALRPMLPEKLREIFAEGNPDWLEGYSREGLTASDVVELLDTQGFFDLLNLPLPARPKSCDRSPVR